MFNIKRIGRVLNRAVTRSETQTFSLSPAAQQVLNGARAKGYKVSTTTRQGTDVVIIEGTGGTIHLWSSDDIVEFGRSKNLL